MNKESGSVYQSAIASLHIVSTVGRLSPATILCRFVLDTPECLTNSENDKPFSIRYFSTWILIFMVTPHIKRYPNVIRYYKQIIALLPFSMENDF